MDERLILTDEFLPGRDEQDLHLARVIPRVVEELYVDVHIVDVERDVLLRFPLNRLLEFLHRHQRQVDPLDDHRVARDRYHRLFGLHASLVDQSPDGVDHSARVHHRTIDDGLRWKRLHGERHEPISPRLGVMLQLHQLYTARSDIQTDGALIPT